MIPLTKSPRFMLVGLVDTREDKDRSFAQFEEAQSLIHTFGGQVYAAVAQNSTRSDTDTFIGKGKARELGETITTEKIDIVVINANIKPRQLNALKTILRGSNPDIQVWDRVDLILNIFRKHASTSEAKLQIRLASVRHMGPLIFGMGKVMSQQAGGIGTRGIGETNTERMNRHWKDEMKKIRDELDKLTANRTQQMDRRKRNGLSTISIVGYTNAGKTTLFNRIGKKQNVAANALFATLDSSVSKLYLQELKKEVFLTDTIGFIQDLPPDLIEAFKSTLLETVHADLLLHVIDASDPWMDDKIAVVEDILYDLQLDTKNHIYVFNKSDQINGDSKELLMAKYATQHPQFVSAKTGEGIEGLVKMIGKSLS